MTLLKLFFPSLLCILYLCGAEKSQFPILDDQSTSRTHRVAIIGGGAAGASTAYHLRKYARELEYTHPVNITIFESSYQIGGRTMTVNAFDDEAYPVELGASVFVKANPILYNATLEFGLVTSSILHDIVEESKYNLGVWDGTKFVFKQSNSESRWSGWWDIAKLLWKYGISPIRVQRLAQGMVGRFLGIYESPIFPFQSLQKAVEEAEMLHLMALTGEELLRDKGVGARFANDIVQASTRVNYAQNLNQIHGLESLVCMAVEGAMAVEGGNWQIFDEMVKRANAEVRLGSSVVQVARGGKSDAEDGDFYILSVDDKAAIVTHDFDTVILAAPYQFANISFPPKLDHTPQEIDYVDLHVTLFTSPHLLSPAFFSLPPDAQDQVPSTILTTLPPRPVPEAEAEPHQFFSISTIRVLPQSSHASTPQYLYKIFSLAPLKASLLAGLFGFDFFPASDSDGIGDVSSKDITWYHHKLWHSYPYEIPRTTFEHIRLNGKPGSGTGVWYTSGIESFISTMETSALMGANVAMLVMEELGQAEGWGRSAQN